MSDKDGDAAANADDEEDLREEGIAEAEARAGASDAAEDIGSECECTRGISASEDANAGETNCIIYNYYYYLYMLETDMK